MDNTDQTLSEQKEKLRYNALEKEVIRLKSSSLKQKKKIILISALVFFLLAFIGAETFMFMSNKQQSKDVYLKNTSKLFIDSILEIKPIIIKSNGISFKVQIGAYAKSDVSLQKFKENLVDLNEEVKGDNKVFTLGNFKNHIEALEFLQTIKKIGFKDAFIVAYENNQVIPVHQAIKITAL